MVAIQKLLKKQMQRIKKLVPIQKKQIKREMSKNILLEYMGYIDDKLFKKHSKAKNFSSFINEFDHATNEEDKENVVKEL